MNVHCFVEAIRLCPLDSIGPEHCGEAVAELDPTIVAASVTVPCSREIPPPIAAPLAATVEPVRPRSTKVSMPPPRALFPLRRFFAMVEFLMLAVVVAVGR